MPLFSSSSTKYCTQASNLSFFWMFLPNMCDFRLQLLILNTMSIRRSSMALRNSQLPQSLTIEPSLTFSTCRRLTSLLNMAFRISLLGFLVLSKTLQTSEMISLAVWLHPISGMYFPTICLMVMTSCFTILWLSEEEEEEEEEEEAFLEVAVDEWERGLSSPKRVVPDSSLSCLTKSTSGVRTAEAAAGLLTAKKSMGVNSSILACIENIIVESLGILTSNYHSYEY